MYDMQFTFVLGKKNPKAQKDLNVLVPADLFWLQGEHWDQNSLSKKSAKRNLWPNNLFLFFVKSPLRTYREIGHFF